MSHPVDAAGHPDVLPFVAAIAGLLIVVRNFHEWLYPPEPPRKRILGRGPKPR